MENHTLNPQKHHTFQTFEHSEIPAKPNTSYIWDFLIRTLGFTYLWIDVFLFCHSTQPTHSKGDVHSDNSSNPANPQNPVNPDSGNYQLPTANC